MTKLVTTKPTESIWKGALAGLAGGLAGAAAKAYLEEAYTRRLIEVQTPLRLGMDIPVDALASGLPFAAVGVMQPWIFGGFAGMAYGVAVETEPTAASWQGAAFGLAVDRMTRTDNSAGAGQGTAVDAGATEAEIMHARITRGLTYGVFGIVTEIVRRSVRRGLG